MLRTIDYGTIRIANKAEITRFDKEIDYLWIDEIGIYQLANGEIVAVEGVTI